MSALKSNVGDATRISRKKTLEKPEHKPELQKGQAQARDLVRALEVPCFGVGGGAVWAVEK